MIALRLMSFSAPNRRERLLRWHALVVAALMPLAAPAVTFTLGDWDASLDTTLSLGASYRLDDPDPDFYGTSNGGLQHSVNADDGNLNYERGISSLVLKGTSDLSIRGDRFQAFFRATYFYDHENQEGDRARTPLTDAALDQVGQDFEMLDYFIVGKFDLGEMPLDLRLGSQVLSWGESTFIQNGINVINPIDVARIRVPGAELKDALTPVPMLSASLGLTENVSLEAFYQLQWNETEIDPPGTYFSSNDFAGAGGSRVFLGFGSIGEDSPLGFVPRGADAEASDSGQGGVAVRVLVPELNSTEFGFYFIRYHSRLPLISAQTPTSPIDIAAVQANAGGLAQANLAPAMIGAGFPAAGVPDALTTLLGAAFTNVPAEALPATLQPFYPTAQAITAGASQIGFLQSAATARYLIEYPEDISLIGASFNMDVGSSGVSLQGELSYKADHPLQIDDVELLFAAVSSINPAFGANNQIGDFIGQLDTRVQGWERLDVWQGQMTATKLFGPVLGASQMLLLAEIGFTSIPDLPDTDVLRMDGPGTFTGGSQAAMNGTGFGAIPATPAEAFADDLSWGYQVVARLEYNNALFGMNITPTLAFSHDVSGNTPLPLGNFIEGRKTLSASVEFSYLYQYAFQLRYVNYFGAGVYNLLSDRDFVSATFQYSF